MIAIFLNHEGVIKGNTFPEKPDFKKLKKDKNYQDYKFFSGYKDKDVLKQWEDEHQHAIDSALDIEDQMTVLDVMFPENLKIELMKPYPIEGYELEEIELPSYHSKQPKRKQYRLKPVSK